MKLVFKTFAVGLLIASNSLADIREEIQRAERFGRESLSLITHNDIRPFWAEDGTALVYQVNTGRGTHRFFRVDLKSGIKSDAFDHEALAKALSKATSRKLGADSLPLENILPSADPSDVRFRAFGEGFRFDGANKQVTKDNVPPKQAALLSPEEAVHASRGGSGSTVLTIENATDGEIEMFWVEGRGQRKSYGRLAPGQSRVQNTYAGHVWIMSDAQGRPLAGVVAKDAPSVARVTERISPAPRKRDDVSPDGKWRAVIRNHNILIEPATGGEAIPLSTGGAGQDRYTGPFQWSPDSKKVAAWRAKEVETRKVHIVQSSPPDQVQPKLQVLDYAKPGDPIRQPKPRLFDIAGKREIPVSDELFANPWDISETAWSADSSEFSFVYNQRGHQLLRLVGLRADSGSARVIFEDTSKTFIDYSQKFWMRRLPATKEILWTSERDGFNHLYLIDSVSGNIRNLITKGEWIVREVMDVDETKRSLLLKVIGVPGQDPYQAHFVRINFDSSGFTRLTGSDGNHGIEFSPDGNWLLDTWSRPDQPPVVELRRASDGKLLTELERADDSALQKTGWSRPDRFVAKGRDGKTDIHGVIFRPTRFDSAKKYPVLEDIYAGPQDYFAPKNFLTWSPMNDMAEQGFIVVRLDGMGTNWRAKAFHDVAWKNLIDAGFPDRIPWIKAAAATRPWMDLTRVGLYGGSAGGQNALAGLLTHGDFYQAAVADCGCHDNRMDKIWWNELWMGWPVGPHYAEQSNVTQAHRLQGKLMLIVGELDDNVDPSSTMQVAHALVKADKDFDLVLLPGTGHGAAETPYGSRRRADFFVRHLLGEATLSR